MFLVASYFDEPWCFMNHTLLKMSVRSPKQTRFASGLCIFQKSWPQLPPKAAIEVMVLYFENSFPTHLETPAVFFLTQIRFISSPSFGLVKVQKQKTEWSRI